MPVTGRVGWVEEPAYGGRTCRVDGRGVGEDEEPACGGRTCGVGGEEAGRVGLTDDERPAARRSWQLTSRKSVLNAC